MELQKFKDLAVSGLMINQTASVAMIEAFKKFAGKEYDTYFHGLTNAVYEVTKNARKIIEESADFANAKK